MFTQSTEAVFTFERRIDSSHSDGRCALDVVIECTVCVSISLQQTKRIRIAKVFKLNERGFAKHSVDCLHELVQQHIVLRCKLAATLLDTKIKVIVEQRFVVGSSVDVNGQQLRRRDASNGCVQRDFSDRDTHSECTQIAQTEDALSIGHHNRFHLVFVGPLRQFRFHSADIVRSEPHSVVVFMQHISELLAGGAHRRCVHNRHQLVQVVNERVIKQLLVQFENVHQISVALQVIVQASNVVHHQFTLQCQLTNAKW
mmetsp:Transcript_11595/g.18693  ORF Transcript_11595/g.18693 Transcript_11595/m.18693 type:complete len:257 (-) Transcript_11595:325-1095(-)